MPVLGKSLLDACLMVQFKKAGDYSPGQQLKVDEIFKVGDKVDVAGQSIGKGFQGIYCSHHAASPAHPVTMKQLMVYMCPAPRPCISGKSVALLGFSLEML